MTKKIETTPIIFGLFTVYVDQAFITRVRTVRVVPGRVDAWTVSVLFVSRERRSSRRDLIWSESDRFYS